MKKYILLTVVAALGLLSVLLPVRQAANARHHFVPPLASPGIPGVLDKSIAVLPFLDLSDNQQMAYFAKDLREEILLKLAKSTALKSFALATQHTFWKATCVVLTTA
jgi:TolB-like protein